MNNRTCDRARLPPQQSVMDAATSNRGELPLPQQLAQGTPPRTLTPRAHRLVSSAKAGQAHKPQSLRETDLRHRANVGPVPDWGLITRSGTFCASKALTGLPDHENVSTLAK